MTIFVSLFGTVIRASFAEQFLGSPLIILAGAIVIAVIAVAYHRIRK